MLNAKPDSLFLESLDALPGSGQLFGCEKLWLTRAQFSKASKVLAGGLRKAGVKAKKPVLILQPNCHTYPLSLVALWRLNAPAVPLSLTVSPGELGSICEQTGAQIVLVDTETKGLSLVASLPAGCALLCVDELLDHGTPIRTDTRAAATDLAAIIYTSGSSGQPKGVMHTRSSLFYAAANYLHELSTGSYFDRPIQDVTYINMFPMST
ncbi:MAG: AMP-binding protein, partial [Candidatus Saccharimonadales bacterium]